MRIPMSPFMAPEKYLKKEEALDSMFLGNLEIIIRKTMNRNRNKINHKDNLYI